MNTGRQKQFKMLPETAPKAIRWLMLGAVIGPILFTLAWIVLGSPRPDYSFVSQPISALGIGPKGPLMNVAMMLNGLLTTVGVIAVFQGLKHELGAVARWACTLLLAVSPLGILLAGIFTLDSPDLHKVGAQLGFGTPIISFLIVGLVLRRVPSWRTFGTWMLLGAVLTLTLLIGFTASVPESQMLTGGGRYGLWQRALITEVLAGFAALGWSAFRRSSAGTGD